MATSKAAEIQTQIRENSNDLSDFLKDLKRWEANIKNEDKNLKNINRLEKQLPPVRTKLNTTNKPDVGKKNETKKDVRIKSYDYNSWEKYNVDDACKSSDEEDQNDDLDEEEQEKIENERRIQNAIIEKEKGNQLFNEGKFEASINRYTNAITMHPTNPILYANRGMALLKVERYASAEADCTTALELDPKYTKALARRATAREKLHKYIDALKDYEDLLNIEPLNRQAISEQEKIKKLISKISTDKKKSNMIDPQKKRSKKPLKRIIITEVGKEINHTPCSLPLNNKQPLLTDEDRVKAGGNSTSSYISTAVKSVKKLSVPSSSFIFEIEFKEIKKDEEQLYEYIKIIPTSLYNKLFSQCVDGLISPFIQVLHNCYLRDNLPIYEELKSFSKVPRFQMASMFLSQHDKTLLKKLLQSCSSSCSKVSSQDIISLCNEYGVKL